MFAMGISYVEGILSHPVKAASRVGLRFLVDTGAFYTTVPRDTLRTLGIRPSREEVVRCADGRKARWKVGEARLSVNGRSTTTSVLFGKANTQPLLGAYSLEGVCLEVDPCTKKLKPIPTLIVATSSTVPTITA